MSIALYDGVDGLFDIQGRIFKVIEDLDTTRATDIPAAVDAAIAKIQLLGSDPDFASLPAPMASGMASWQAQGSTLFSAMATAAASLAIEMANDDVVLDAKTLANALAAIIQQMIDDGDSVDASTVAATVTAGASNYGDGVLIVSTIDGNGRATEHAKAETIEATVASDGLAASIGLAGDPSVSRDSADWPAGSGASASVSAVSANSSLIANGSMEAETVIDNAPDGWIVSVGTPGSNVNMTNPEIQTITITGSPSAGWYAISWANPEGFTQTTAPLAYNASGSAVQSALRLLTGLESITVVASGTTPNYTHTITFAGKGGNVSQFTINNQTTGGTITPTTSSAGDGKVFAGGKALAFTGNGSVVHAINSRLTTLQPSTAYAFSAWLAVDIAPLSGVISVELIDGIGGSVIADDEGNANSFTLDCTALSGTFKHAREVANGPTVIRTPAIVPPIVYLRIRFSTALPGTSILYLDHVALAAMSEIYPGGPLAAAFSGSKTFKAGDSWDIAITNNRAGKLQEFYNRCFDMASLGLLLPSNAAGGETIPDSVVA